MKASKKILLLSVTSVTLGVLAYILYVASVPTAYAQTAACPIISKTLMVGSRGAEVTSLQQYLAQDISIYPEASVTGYFGPATQRAVQRWQARAGIVTSGTPATTGFGMVGKRTRSALAACTAIQTSTSQSTTTTAATTTSTATVPPPAPTVPATTVSTPVQPEKSATTAVTEGSGPTPLIETFGAGPRVIQYPKEPVYIYWNAPTAQTCSVQKASGSSYSDVFANAGKSGGVYVYPETTPTTYSLLCSGVGDTATSSPATTVRKDFDIRISTPTASCTITPSQTSYTYGSTVQVSWTSENADSVEFERPTSADDVQPPYGKQMTSGFFITSAVSGITTQTLKLKVYGKGGNGTCTASYTITPPTSQ